VRETTTRKKRERDPEKWVLNVLGKTRGQPRAWGILISGWRTITKKLKCSYGKSKKLRKFSENGRIEEGTLKKIKTPLGGGKS